MPFPPPPPGGREDPPRNGDDNDGRDGSDDDDDNSGGGYRGGGDDDDDDDDNDDDHRGKGGKGKGKGKGKGGGGECWLFCPFNFPTGPKMGGKQPGRVHMEASPLAITMISRTQAQTDAKPHEQRPKPVDVLVMHGDRDGHSVLRDVRDVRILAHVLNIQLDRDEGLLGDAHDSDG
ncbi:hypothetical protein P152DRAFT_475383 [Eremomyces bilateralis CBS 781.70]|uniref:Uncharacterized protein n=1 Tax=Eremomyces bilateralis CBS 781.70 TaxID=1392243 RepID=A0A6G1FXV2_9PEZI|nr:uncharacterized protein P152DRAFT_475383 [Eremomyces bilateralis CBS 781.70]KAF1810542.1 hypothetical protein P152DRAFT_475383 [Eremomyces bilateralis CBS 781.70]